MRGWVFAIAAVLLGACEANELRPVPVGGDFAPAPAPVRPD
jgi:hypothetical protein